jgi:hypothetical protein
MTDHSEFFSEARKGSSFRHQTEQQEAIESQKKLIPVQLPLDIAIAIEQQLKQSEQTQAQDIFEGLRAALGLPSKQAAETSNLEQFAEPATEKLREEFRLLKIRLTELESLVPKMESLEGKLTAF